MALPASVDYTSKDFESIRLRQQAMIRSVFPTWTDFQVTNFGNILTDMSAFVLDVIAFTQDNQAAESRIVTATQRRSLLALTKLINYVPELAAPATTDETFTATGLVNNATIPAGTVIKTATDAVPFQLLSPLLLTPGAPSNTGTVENSTTETQLYTGTGLPSQTLALPLSPFLSVVSVALGGSWTKVDNFLFSSATDKAYTVNVDNNDIATLAFGDGVNGLMPTGSMTVTYKIGGGAAGNVAAESITEIDGVILDTLGNLVNLVAINNEAASGGQDRESNASIKLRAPLSITNPTSSIARTDFEVHAIEVPGVNRALMLTTNEDVSVADNSGRLYIVPSGNPPGDPSVVKIDQVRLQFEGDTQARPPFPKPLTFSINVRGAQYVLFTVTAKIFLKKNFVPATVAGNIRAAMAQFFNPIVEDAARAETLGVEIGAQNPLIDFGYYLRLANASDTATTGFIELSDLMDVVHDVEGVRGIGTLPEHFTVTAERVIGSVFLATDEHVDVALADADFPKYDSMIIIDLDTGASI